MHLPAGEGCDRDISLVHAHTESAESLSGMYVCLDESWPEDGPFTAVYCVRGCSVH